MGWKKQMEKRHKMVDRVHKAVHSVHDFGHFFTTWWFSCISYYIRKDSAKPINQSKFDKTFIIKFHKYMHF